MPGWEKAALNWTRDRHFRYKIYQCDSEDQPWCNSIFSRKFRQANRSHYVFLRDSGSTKRILHRANLQYRQVVSEAIQEVEHSKTKTRFIKRIWQEVYATLARTWPFLIQKIDEMGMWKRFCGAKSAALPTMISIFFIKSEIRNNHKISYVSNHFRFPYSKKISLPKRLSLGVFIEIGTFRKCFAGKIPVIRWSFPFHEKRDPTRCLQGWEAEDRATTSRCPTYVSKIYGLSESLLYTALYQYNFREFSSMILYPEFYTDKPLYLYDSPIGGKNRGEYLFTRASHQIKENCYLALCYWDYVLAQKGFLFARRMSNH